jgi:thioredoxin reductase
MTCANALHTFGIEAVVIERSEHLGGAQRTNFHPNLWLLGSPEETGREVTERMVRHFRGLPIQTYTRTQVSRVARAEDGGFSIDLDSPEGPTNLHATAIVIATGMQPRATPELAALAQTTERIIIGPLSDTIRDGIREARVLILGGGDNALDHALYLAERRNRITVCARRRFSARPGFMSACAANSSIETRTDCVPESLAIDADGLSARCFNQHERYDWLLVMYGYSPNTELLRGFDTTLQPILSASGHIRTDAWQRTSVAGLYSAGDITDAIQPSVLTAIAQGLAAAKAIERLSQEAAPTGILANGADLNSKPA